MAIRERSSHSQQHTVLVALTTTNWMQIVKIASDRWWDQPDGSDGEKAQPSRGEAACPQGSTPIAVNLAESGMKRLEPRWLQPRHTVAVRLPCEAVPEAGADRERPSLHLLSAALETSVTHRGGLG